MAEKRTSPKRRRKIVPLPPIVPQDLRDSIEDLTYVHRNYADGFHHLRLALAYLVRQDLRSKEREAGR